MGYPIAEGWHRPHRWAAAAATAGHGGAPGGGRPLPLAVPSAMAGREQGTMLPPGFDDRLGGGPDPFKRQGWGGGGLGDPTSTCATAR